MKIKTEKLYVPWVQDHLALELEGFDWTWGTPENGYVSVTLKAWCEEDELYLMNLLEYEDIRWKMV